MEQPSREELRARLRNKIATSKNKRNHQKINKKQLGQYADKLKTISNTIDKYQLSSEHVGDLPTQLVEEIKGIVSEDEIKTLVDYLKQNNTANLNNSMISFLNDIKF